MLRTGGVLAVWCYEVFEATPEVDAVISDLYHRVVGPHWPPERRWIETGYDHRRGGPCHRWGLDELDTLACRSPNRA